MTRKKSLVAAVGLAIALSSTGASATGLPVIDYIKIAYGQLENTLREADFEQVKALYERARTAVGDGAGYTVDSINNGVANLVIRTEQMKGSVFNIERVAEAKPMQSACSAITIQRSGNQLLCGKDNLFEIIRKAMNYTSESSIDIVADAKKAVNAVGALNILASEANAPGAKTFQSKSAEALAKHNAETEAAIDRYNAYVEAGMNPDDPNLLIINDNFLPYTDDELVMALTMARLSYPPYVRPSNTDPVNEREATRDLRNKLAIETANSTIMRHIALRTPLIEGLPSELMVLTMPVALKFDEKGEIAKGENWIHQIGLDAGTPPAEVSKESLLMKGLKVKQAIAAYKSQLQRESLIQKLVIQRVDPASRS